MAEVGFFRRIAPAVILAAAGGLLLYLLPSGSDADTGAEDIGASEDTARPSSGPSASVGSDGTGSDGTGSDGTGTGATGQASPSATAPQVIQGDAVDFRFGTVQVSIAVEGGALTDITTITAPGGGYQRYTDRAIPTMRKEILAAQSTDVAAVSGATYTSEAYAQSVQSALDRM